MRTDTAAPAGPGAPARPGAGGGLAATIASEWTKLWSVRSTWWSLAGTAGLMGVFGASFGYRPNQPAGTPPPEHLMPVEQAAMGSLLLAQFVLLALAVLVITAEYASGSIRSTLLWDPRRGRVLLAKAAVLALVALVVGTAVAALAAIVAELFAGAYGVFVLSDVAATSARIGCYLSVAALFALGIGTAIRSTAGALTAVFLLLLLMPFVLSRSASDLILSIAHYLPGIAGMEFIGMAELLDLGGLPYGPTGGLVVLLAWTGAALLTGYAVLRLRDA